MTFKVKGTSYLDFKGIEVQEKEFPKYVVKMMFGWKKHQKLAIGLFTDEPSNVTIQNYRRQPRIVELKTLKLIKYSQKEQDILEGIINHSTVFAGTKS